MRATLAPMPKRKKPEEAAPLPSGSKRTMPVRIEEGLAEKIILVAKILKKDVSDLLSPQVRDYIEREYAKAVKLLQGRVDPERME